MPGTWKSDYLLNLVLVARSDGELRPIEVLFLSTCRAKLDASNCTLADAVMRSYWEGAVSTGGIISNEQDLRDMITMSILDGCTDIAEQDMVFKFVDSVQVPNYRVEAIIRESFSQLHVVKAGIESDVNNRIALLSHGKVSDIQIRR